LGIFLNACFYKNTKVKDWSWVYWKNQNNRGRGPGLSELYFLLAVVLCLMKAVSG